MKRERGEAGEGIPPTNRQEGGIYLRVYTSHNGVYHRVYTSHNGVYLRVWYTQHASLGCGIPSMPPRVCNSVYQLPWVCNSVY